MRPNTLAVATKHRKQMDTRKFISEVLHAWRAKARCNIVPAERLHELFDELKFSPTEKQINEMLQTAKLFARRGNNGFEVRNTNRQLNGLTFGEFCVLAADLKRFRTQASPLLARYDASDTSINTSTSEQTTHSVTDGATNQSSNELKPNDGNSAPEVFLGGSCNPTTWRADVAIPTLNKLGISFYNPQVSDWTPDLIELEHRAKEKARVLFFVMDSETRASAGAIEAAHIAGQNARHLVLVLHPYKQDQCISNEPISSQEYLDLKRNQQLLRELVTRRGLPVLDSVPSGLQQTRAILAGSSGFYVPQNIGSRLIAVRRAFDRVLDKRNECPSTEQITLEQCQCALNFLGYAQNLLLIDSLYEIVMAHREIAQINVRSVSNTEITIDFEEFCVLTSYLTILQEEISESGCISPIKGTNLPPPPIFLTNTPEWLHNHQNSLNEAGLTALTSITYSKHMCRSGSGKTLPAEKSNLTTYTTTVISDTCRNHRDSGTSSPQPNEGRSLNSNNTSDTATTSSSLSDVESNTNIRSINGKTKISLNVECSNSISSKQHEEIIVSDETEEELSDSNDSVFSSGSSIDSILNYSNPTEHLLSEHSSGGGGSASEIYDLRDIYLGGSCVLRTSWRNDVVIPLLNQHNVTYHLPQTHESIVVERENGKAANEEPSGSSALETCGSNDSGISTGRKKSSMRLFTTYATNTSSKTGVTIHYSHHSVGRRSLLNLSLLDSSRVLLFVITNETRSLAPMTLAAHCIGLGYNIVLCIQMLSECCVIGKDRLTPAAIKDYNRGRAYLIDLAKRQDVPVFHDLRQAVECAIEKVKLCKCRNTV